jgi:hypothetical protein
MESIVKVTSRTAHTRINEEVGRIYRERVVEVDADWLKVGFSFPQ